MKKYVFVLLALAFVISIPIYAHAQQVPPAQTVADEISVTIDGILQQFEVPPQMINDRVMLPLRAIAEALHLTVNHDAATNTALLTGPGLDIRHQINSRVIYVNGITEEFDVPSLIIDGRTLVPARMIAEATGADVQWDGATRTAVIIRAATSPVEPPAVAAVPTETQYTLQQAADYHAGQFFAAAYLLAEELRIKTANNPDGLMEYYLAASFALGEMLGEAVFEMTFLAEELSVTDSVVLFAYGYQLGAHLYAAIEIIAEVFIELALELGLEFDFLAGDTGIYHNPQTQANQQLVGTWYWMTIPYYVFYANHEGRMMEVPIRWSTYNGVLSICTTPAQCSNRCHAPSTWYYEISGDTLTLTSTMFPDMIFTYTR